MLARWTIVALRRRHSDLARADAGRKRGLAFQTAGAHYEQNRKADYNQGSANHRDALRMMGRLVRQQNRRRRIVDGAGESSSKFRSFGHSLS